MIKGENNITKNRCINENNFIFVRFLFFGLQDNFFLKKYLEETTIYTLIKFSYKFYSFK